VQTRTVGVLGVAALFVVSAACAGDEQGSAEELCAAVGDGTAFAATFEGFDPTDTEAALAQLRAARVTLGDLRDVAPSQVRDDLTIEVDYIQAMLEGLEAAEPDNPGEAVAAVQRATAAHPDVDEANARLVTWTAEQCP
jgi:hypothetical protein